MWWVYLGIFFAKLVEVSLSTVRMVLINRGEKLKGALLGFCEAMIWVIVISQVLSGLSEDPLKLVVYCLAFACGNYLGVLIEQKLAIGTSLIQAVVGNEIKDELSAALRAKGFGVTHVCGEGMDGAVDILMIYLKRKGVQEAIKLIKECSPNAMFTVNDVRFLKNGYIRK